MATKKKQQDKKTKPSKSYVGFEKLKNELAARGDVDNPEAVAASIGKKKYGKKKMQQAAAKGKSLKNA